MQQQGRGTLYVSGEESPLQVKLRADRLDEPAGDVALLSETLSRR
jgi:DNA repair protein RadA/Sms